MGRKEKREVGTADILPRTGGEGGGELGQQLEGGKESRKKGDGNEVVRPQPA